MNADNCCVQHLILDWHVPSWKRECLKCKKEVEGSLYCLQCAQKESRCFFCDCDLKEPMDEKNILRIIEKRLGQLEEDEHHVQYWEIYRLKPIQDEEKCLLDLKLKVEANVFSSSQGVASFYFTHCPSSELVSSSLELS